MPIKHNIDSNIMLQPNQGLPMWLILTLSAMAGISVANIYYCQPLLNAISVDTGLSTFEVNLMPVLTQGGYALGLLLIVPLGDLCSRRKTIIASFSTVALALLAIFFAHSTPLLLAASFVTGFCSVAPQVFIPFVVLYAKPEQKERKAGIVLSGLLTGILASRVVSGYVGHELGWRSMYLMAAAVMTVSTFAVMKVFPDVKPTYRGTFASLMKSIRKLAAEHPRSMLYSIRSAFAFGSMLGLWACLAFRMKEAPFFADSDTVGMLALCGVVGALTASNVGRYIPRFGVERINALGCMLILLSWIIMGLFDHTYIGLILGVMIIDIGMQCIQLSNQSATMRLCPEATSRMNTIFMVTYFIGGSFGTFLSGTLWSLWGWMGTVAAGTCLVLCSMAATMAVKILDRHSAKAQRY